MKAFTSGGNARRGMERLFGFYNGLVFPRSTVGSASSNDSDAEDKLNVALQDRLLM